MDKSGETHYENAIHFRNTGGMVPVRVGQGVVQVRVEAAGVSPVVQVAAGKPSHL